MKSKKALSPVVVAVIIIIAVTVAVSITVAVWIQANFTNRDQMVFSLSYIRQSWELEQSNITVVQTNRYEPCKWIEYYNFTVFKEQIKKYNVSHVVTDYQSFEEPRYIEKGILYCLGDYHIWFYVNFANVGETAMTYRGSETVWLREEA